MMKKILISFLVFMSAFGHAQKLTNEQVEQYLDGLKNEEIISEFGKDAIYKMMTTENGNVLNALSQNPPLSRQKQKDFLFPDSLIKSKQTILFVCGVLDLMRNVGSSVDELVQIREAVEKMLGEKMLFRNQIVGEANIKNPLTFIQLSMNLKPSRDNYLQLILSLKKVKLIDERIEKELFSWLERDKIHFIKDFSPFIFAAKQSFFYENYELLKSEQLSYLDSLNKASLIAPQDLDSLIKSYQPFELKSNIEILSKVKNSVLVDFNPLQTTRAEIYEKTFADIKKKVLPNIHYKDLILKEITPKKTDKVDATMPFLNPMMGLLSSFKKNSKSYQLAVQITNQKYIQKSETDFTLINKLNDILPPDVRIDSIVLKAYLPLIQSFTGFANNDIQVFNDYLTDVHSEERLFVASNGFNPFSPNSDSRKVILFLDKSQYLKVFQSKKRKYTFGPNNLGEKGASLKDTDFFSKNDSRDSLRKILYSLQSVSIIPQLSETDLDNIIVETRLENKKFNLPRNLLKTYLPTLKNTFSKSESDENLFFKNFISDLTFISNGKFNPEKPYDNFDKELKKDISEKRVLEFGFKMGGKKYENQSELYTVDKDLLNPQTAAMIELYKNARLPSSLIPEYIGLANAALIGSQIDGQFYDLDDNKIIFLTKAQTDFIITKYPSIFSDFLGRNPTDFYKEAISQFDGKILLSALKREKMVSDSTNTNQTKEPSDIFGLSSDVFVVDMNDFYGKTNKEIYSILFDKIAKKAFDGAVIKEVNLKTEFLENYESDSTFLLSATINGIHYNQLLKSSLADNIKSGVDSLRKEGAVYYPSIGENQFRIVNDYLNDINSKKRLVIVCDYQSPKLSFVFFDSTQAQIVEETLPNNYVDFMMFERDKSIDSLRSFLNELKTNGLVEDRVQVDEIILEYRKEAGDKLNLLLKLPDFVATISATEINYEDTIFRESLNKFSRASKGVFDPKNIVDNFKQMNKKSKYKDRVYSYGFMVGGKKYTQMHKLEGIKKSKNEEPVYDSFGFILHVPSLINLCNKALTDSEIDGAFYKLTYYSEEEEVRDFVVFLNQKQYKFLNTKMPELFGEEIDTETPDFEEKKEDK